MSTATFPTAASRGSGAAVSPINRTTEQWPVPRLIAMHLLPGLIIVGGYAVIAWAMRGLAVPSLLPLVLAIPVTLVPAELGYLLYQGKRRHGHLTLQGVIDYNQPLTGKQYAIWIPATLLATIMLFVLFGFTDGILLQRVFFWWPAWMNPDFGSLAGLSPLALWTTIGMLMLFGNWIGPAVEELYFRGYLLPRMEHLGRWGVVLNGVLFASYHFWSPWSVFSRAVAILPLGFVARSKRNVIVPIVVHCALNTIGTLLVLGAIL